MLGIASLQDSLDLQTKMGCLWWCLLMLGAVAFLTEDCSGSSSSSSHSLRLLYTVLAEFDQEQPEVTVLGYVDDQLIFRYDSSTRQIRPQVAWMSKMRAEDPQYWDKEIQRIQSWSLELKQMLNIFTRLPIEKKVAPTLQYMEGCKVLSNGNNEGYAASAYDGRRFLTFDRQAVNWRAADFMGHVLRLMFLRNSNQTQKLKSYLEEECIEQLRKFLEIGKEALLRKESPVVKATRWVGNDSLQILVCQAYGFYPKEIDITWRKDGEVWEQDHFPNAVAPNSDGTYHTWLSVQIDPKDRDRYQCHVEHDSFQDPLDVAWEDSERHPRNHSTFRQKELGNRTQECSAVASSFCTERTEDVISAVLNLKDTVEKAMRCFEKRLSDLENTVENLTCQSKNE
ncbi:major histocompatibility complex class I-related gene protein-like [Sceloporus undulatus]|uniref:major histocompatibility complex class I-related gene protein-like n=1 Tax=Sceloporus undulatus TaxID=8520 RepID=UPI001C4AE9D4|nr:major histocompatibility complex class I-related gene protein-like [Sceloporus undulatus]